MEEEKKKKEMSNMTKVIAIILFIVFFVLGFFLGRNLFNDNDKKEEKEEKKEEVKVNSELYYLNDGEIDLNNEELKEYLSLFKSNEAMEYYYSIINETSKEKSETIHQAKISLALAKTEYEADKISCSDINVDAETIMDMYYCGYMSDEMTKYYGENIYKFHEAEKNNVTLYKKGEKVEENYKLLFGEDGDFYHESAGLMYFKLAYSPKNNVYAEYQCQCGGTEPPLKETPIKAYKENNKLILVYDNKRVEGDKILEEKTATVTLKWDEKVQRYVFESRELVQK